VFSKIAREPGHFNGFFEKCGNSSKKSVEMIAVGVYNSIYKQTLKTVRTEMSLFGLSEKCQNISK
jgi:uncharacterized membrane protein YiaA